MIELIVASIVVATTYHIRQMISLTSKPQRESIMWGFTRELDKELSLYCSSIYTTTSWSMLQQCVYLISIYYASTLRPPCFPHVPWHHIFDLCYTCAHHVYTIRNPYPLTSSPNPNSISRFFPILLNPKSFQTALDSITWLLDHVLSYPFVYCRLIEYYYNIFTLS